MIKIPEDLRFIMYPNSRIQTIAINRMTTNEKIFELCDIMAREEGRKEAVVRISGWGDTETGRTEHLMSAESFFEFQNFKQLRNSSGNIESIDGRLLLLNNAKVWTCVGDSGGKRNNNYLSVCK